MSAVPTNPKVKLRTVSRRVPRATTEAIDESPEPTMRLSRAIVVMLLLHIVAVGGFFASSVLKEKNLRRDSTETPLPLEAEDSRLPVKESVNSSAKKASITPGLSQPHTHVVRPGETLTLIANESGVTLEALIAANGADTVTTGLRTGQELRLPEKSPEPNSLATESSAGASKLVEGHPSRFSVPSVANLTPTSVSVIHSGQESNRSYVVQKGDSAPTIARKNNVDYNALLKMNQIADPKKIKPGQKLQLPQPANKMK